MKFKLHIDGDRCKGCAFCVAACKCAVLTLANKLNAQGLRFAEVKQPDECGGCKQCAEVCPEGAIEIEKVETPDEDAEDR